MELLQSRYIKLVMQKRPELKWLWISRTVLEPLHMAPQADGRMRYWARIPEYGNRVLRVIVEPDGKTVLNAFFDRRFKEE